MTNVLNEHLEPFIDTIKAESSTRKKQLTYLKDILEKINDNTHKITFMKITIPEIYAQFEGFFKFLFYEFINYINKIEISNIDINIKYIIFPLLTHLGPSITKQKTKAEKMLSIFDDVFSNKKNILEISQFDDYILNLNSTKHTMKILGIDSHRIPMRQLDLLYERRCEIAHGNISENNPFYISSEMDITDFLVSKTYNDYWIKHYETVIYAIEMLSTLFIDYVSVEGYKSA